MYLTMADKEEWMQLAPYVDTLCLPIYRIAFRQKRISLEEKRVVEGVVERVERDLTGRLLLLPAIAYKGEDRSAFHAYVRGVIAELGRSPFHYIVVVFPSDSLDIAEEPGRILYYPLPIRGGASDDEIEEWAAALRGRVIELWQGNGGDEIVPQEKR